MAEKTNVIRCLEQKGIPFQVHNYIPTGAVSGAEAASALSQSPDRVFKTLVCVGRTGAHYVFVVPVSGELDLKKAARSCGEKYVEMVKSKELLPLTGYVHGGCSPIGMKKLFKTAVDESALEFETIFLSAGRIGHQVELSPLALESVIPLTFEDLRTCP